MYLKWELSKQTFEPINYFDVVLLAQRIWTHILLLLFFLLNLFDFTFICRCIRLGVIHKLRTLYVNRQQTLQYSHENRENLCFYSRNFPYTTSFVSEFYQRCGINNEQHGNNFTNLVAFVGTKNSFRCYLAVAPTLRGQRRQSTTMTT